MESLSPVCMTYLDIRPGRVNDYDIVLLVSLDGVGLDELGEILQ